MNPAYRHRSSIEAALSAGYHVVSEKPISFSREETLALLRSAKSRGRSLFCTNTYLFADYLATFSRNWLAGRALTTMSIAWTDAAVEFRYGETKGYDSGVPVIFDVLPHVGNIVLATLGDCEPVPVGISVRRGGSEALIQYRHKDMDIHVLIARNAAKRTRRVTFSGPAGDIGLDFTNEPGTVVVDGIPLETVDPDWQRRRKPIAAMIESVAAFFAAGIRDARLSPLAALIGNALIDAVADSYVAQQTDFLASHRDVTTSPEPDLGYALKESRSIATRTLPYLSPDSPLRQLANAAISVKTNPLPP